MQTSPLAATTVASQAATVLADFPCIGQRINRQKITASVTSTWPAAPAPLIYWLWVASDAKLIGAQGAKQCLASLEALLALLNHTEVVGGSWPSRVGKLYPPKGPAGRDHYTEFRAALFELLLAFQLIRPDVKVNLERDGGPPGCDISIVSHGSTIAAIEAYAPQKGIDEWFRKSVNRPWQARIGETESQHPESEPVTDIFLDPTAVPRALSNVLTDSNFQRQKAKQLASGNVPTLLAIRAYALIPRLENLLTTPSAEKIAEAISDEVWVHLPDRCAGLLLCFTSDILSLLGGGGPIMFIPALGHHASEDLKGYLSDIGILKQNAT